MKRVLGRRVWILCGGNWVFEGRKWILGRGRVLTRWIEVECFFLRAGAWWKGVVA